jgi:two-component system LytT family response regulator
MKEVQLTRSFLKNPLSSLIILLAIVVLIELLSWNIAYEAKLKLVNRAGGLSAYLTALVRSLIIPEITTALVIAALLNLFHRLFKITQVKLSWTSLVRYELSFLPVLLLAYLIFSPITQTVRFLLEAYPDYTLTTYWTGYIQNSLWLAIYVRYLLPVFIIGYLLLNISLLIDFQKSGRASATSTASL